MAYSTKTAGAAFPILSYGWEGMTLRDYFAGQALAAMHWMHVVTSEQAAQYAKDAYLYADAMLAEREK